LATGAAEIIDECLFVLVYLLIDFCTIDHFPFEELKGQAVIYASVKLKDF
jgi:hypothetical protein